MLYSIIGFFAIGIIGSMLHFAYDFMHHNRYISLFVAVNESTWEHLKLAVIPMFVWLVIGIPLDINNLAFGAFVALITVMIVIPVIFYIYTHFTKKSILAIDISSFFVGIGLAMLFAYFIFNAPAFPSVFNIIGIVFNILIALAFIIFTYLPPRIFLFKDPISNKYGLQGHFDDSRYGNNFSIKDRDKK